MMVVGIAVVVVRLVAVIVVVVPRVGRCLPAPIGESHGDLGAGNAAAVRRLDVDRDAVEAQPGGETLQPCRVGPDRDQRAEEHVAAHTGGRVNDREAAI